MIMSSIGGDTTCNFPGTLLCSAKYNQIQNKSEEDCLDLGIDEWSLPLRNMQLNFNNC